MTTLNRTTPPAFKKIESYILPEAESVTLDNGIPLHLILSGTQPVVRLEIIFKAGSWHEPTAGIAHFTTKILSEGTLHHTAKQIQEKFAYYGAFPEFNPGVDRCSITIYSLAKHIEALLPLIHEIVVEASFPEKELDSVKNIALQGLKVNMEKTAFLAGSKFRELIFGSEHPYGHFLSEEDMKATNVHLLEEFYKKNYTIKNCEIILSGAGDINFTKLINTHFGSDNWGKSDVLPNLGHNSISTPFNKREIIAKDDALQSTIRMGKRLFTNAHPDYFNVYFLNEIFGGYFGSRLMQNIREDKGYTYGISSNIICYQNEGYFVIGTDVKKEVTENTISEIYKEMKKMKEEKVSENELESVRNFMLGSFVNSISNPFAVADKFKTIRFNGLDYDFYRNYFNAIRTINANTLLDTANKYFDENSISEAIAGGLKN